MVISRLSHARQYRYGESMVAKILPSALRTLPECEAQHSVFVSRIIMHRGQTAGLSTLGRKKKHDETSSMPSTISTFNYARYGC